MSILPLPFLQKQIRARVMHICCAHPQWLCCPWQIQQQQSTSCRRWASVWLTCQRFLVLSSHDYISRVHGWFRWNQSPYNPNFHGFSHVKNNYLGYTQCKMRETEGYLSVNHVLEYTADACLYRLIALVTHKYRIFGFL